MLVLNRIDCMGRDSLLDMNTGLIQSLTVKYSIILILLLFFKSGFPENAAKIGEQCLFIVDDVASTQPLSLAAVTQHPRQHSHWILKQGRGVNVKAAVSSCSTFSPTLLEMCWQYPGQIRKWAWSVKVTVNKSKILVNVTVTEIEFRNMSSLGKL